MDYICSIMYVREIRIWDIYERLQQMTAILGTRDGLWIKSVIGLSRKNFKDEKIRLKILY